MPYLNSQKFKLMKNLIVLTLLLLLSNLSYGQLNYQIDFNKKRQQDKELEDLDRRLKAENEVKISKIAEMLSPTYTGFPYFDQMIEKLSNEKQDEVNELINTYGDPFESQEAMLKLKKIESSLKRNNWTQEGELVERNLKILESDFQENLISKEQFDIEYKKYTKYICRIENINEIKELWRYVRPSNNQR